MEVPEYDPESVVSANRSCVSIRTIADVDGNVTVTLTSALPAGAREDGLEVFQGRIDSPSGRVAVVTSENEKLLELEVANQKANIRVVVDEEPSPSRIWVEAQPATPAAAPGESERR